MSFPCPPPPTGLVLQGLNALLRREPWALEQLAAHAGKSLRLSAGDAWHLNLSLASDGSLQACDPAVVPDVILAVPTERLGSLPGVWRSQGIAGVTGLIHIQGDAALAQLVFELGRTLRWDAEDDLSRLVGDVLAVRLVHGARRLAGGLRDTARRTGGNLAEYLSHESGLGVHQSRLQAQAVRLREFQKRLDGLEGRVQVLRGRAC